MDFVRGTTRRRPGSSSATTHQASLATVNTKVRAKLVKVLAALNPQDVRHFDRQPAISSVNGSRTGIVEPGGQYEIKGNGFGSEAGTAFIRFANHTLHFRIDHWSDNILFVGLEDNISKVPDAGTVDLFVGIKGKEAIKTNRFGFRAARAEFDLIPAESTFSYDKGSSTVIAGLTVWTCMAPTSIKNNGGYLEVTRLKSYDDAHHGCFAVGFDHIRWNIPLNEGFEVVDFEWYHWPLTDRDADGVQNSFAGRYAAIWEGDYIRVDYGVQRSRTPKFVFVSGHVGCSSQYKIKLKLMGPRGMPPQ